MDNSKSSKIPVTSKRKISSVLARTKDNVSNIMNKSFKPKSPLSSRTASRKDKENATTNAIEEKPSADEKPEGTTSQDANSETQPRNRTEQTSVSERDSLGSAEILIADSTNIISSSSSRYRSLNTGTLVADVSAIPVGIVHDYVEVEKPTEHEGEDNPEEVVVLNPSDVSVTNKSSSDSLSSLVKVTAEEVSSGTVVVTSDVVMSDSRARSKEVISKYICALAEYFPAESAWRRILLACEPGICHTSQLLYVFFSILAIKIEVAWFIALHIWELLQPFQPKLLLPAILGLVLCFFGGSFMALIGAVEAYRLCGYETTLKSISHLKEDFENFKVANDKDDAVLDEDNSGAADVLTVRSGQDLLMRKTALFLKTVDPHRFSDALVGINVGIVAVVATLKVKFAKAVTLGNSIGGLAEEPANQLLLPVLESSLPLHYQGWARPCLRYAVKSICLCFAWYLQRAVSSYHSAITGGIMFGKHILGYLFAVGVIKDKTHVDNHQLVCCIGYLAAFVGIYFQMSFGFCLPFPLNVLLFPFTLLEYALIWIVNNSTSFLT